MGAESIVDASNLTHGMDFIEPLTPRRSRHVRQSLSELFSDEEDAPLDVFVASIHKRQCFESGKASWPSSGNENGGGQQLLSLLDALIGIDAEGKSLSDHERKHLKDEIRLLSLREGEPQRDISHCVKEALDACSMENLDDDCEPISPPRLLPGKQQSVPELFKNQSVNVSSASARIPLEKTQSSRTAFSFAKQFSFKNKKKDVTLDTVPANETETSQKTSFSSKFAKQFSFRKGLGSKEIAATDSTAVNALVPPVKAPRAQIESDPVHASPKKATSNRPGLSFFKAMSFRNGKPSKEEGKTDSINRRLQSEKAMNGSSRILRRPSNEGSSRQLRRTSNEGSSRQLRRPSNEESPRQLRRTSNEGSSRQPRRTLNEGSSRQLRLQYNEGSPRQASSRRLRNEGSSRQLRRSSNEDSSKQMRRSSNEDPRKPKHLKKRPDSVYSSNHESDQRRSYAMTRAQSSRTGMALGKDQSPRRSQRKEFQTPRNGSRRAMSSRDIMRDVRTAPRSSYRSPSKQKPSYVHYDERSYRSPSLQSTKQKSFRQRSNDSTADRALPRRGLHKSPSARSGMAKQASFHRKSNDSPQKSPPRMSKEHNFSRRTSDSPQKNPSRLPKQQSFRRKSNDSSDRSPPKMAKQQSFCLKSNESSRRESQQRREGLRKVQSARSLFGEDANHDDERSNPKASLENRPMKPEMNANDAGRRQLLQKSHSTKSSFGMIKQMSFRNFKKIWTRNSSTTKSTKSASSEEGTIPCSSSAEGSNQENMTIDTCSAESSRLAERRNGSDGNLARYGSEHEEFDLPTTTRDPTVKKAQKKVLNSSAGVNSDHHRCVQSKSPRRKPKHRKMRVPACIELSPEKSPEVEHLEDKGAEDGHCGNVSSISGVSSKDEQCQVEPLLAPPFISPIKQHVCRQMEDTADPNEIELMPDLDDNAFDQTSYYSTSSDESGDSSLASGTSVGSFPSTQIIALSASIHKKIATRTQVTSSLPVTVPETPNRRTACPMVGDSSSPMPSDPSSPLSVDLSPRRPIREKTKHDRQDSQTQGSSECVSSEQSPRAVGEIAAAPFVASPVKRTPASASFVRSPVKRSSAMSVSSVSVSASFLRSPIKRSDGISVSGSQAAVLSPEKRRGVGRMQHALSVRDFSRQTSVKDFSSRSVNPQATPIEALQLQAEQRAPISSIHISGFGSGKFNANDDTNDDSSFSGESDVSDLESVQSRDPMEKVAASTEPPVPTAVDHPVDDPAAAAAPIAFIDIAGFSMDDDDDDDDDCSSMEDQDASTIGSVPSHCPSAALCLEYGNSCSVSPRKPVRESTGHKRATTPVKEPPSTDRGATEDWSPRKPRRETTHHERLVVPVVVAVSPV